jgi:hypothetical protein
MGCWHNDRAAGSRQRPSCTLTSPAAPTALGRRGAAHARVPALAGESYTPACSGAAAALPCVWSRGPRSACFAPVAGTTTRTPAVAKAKLRPRSRAWRADHAHKGAAALVARLKKMPAARGKFSCPCRGRVANAGSMDLMKILSSCRQMQSCVRSGSRSLSHSSYGGSSLAHAHVGPGGGRDGHGCKATGFRSRRGGGEEGELRAETLAAARP